jgi:protein arginine kinase
MPSPGWLSGDAPEGDVVLSSRVRIMRNLAGVRFVHRSDTAELLDVMQAILAATRHLDLELETFKALTNAERDYLVSCRLVSPDFEWTLPGRALLFDASRTLAVMINEEDHLRVQALTAGLSVLNAQRIAGDAICRLGAELEFAFSPDFGYLSASHINLGAGKRMSAMFHLIGLAQVRRLTAVIKALNEKGIVVRGLFGESSRAVGAFAQISVISRSHEEFAGACEYLLREERAARRTVGVERLQVKAAQAKEFAKASPVLSLADALRVLAWVRWAASSRLPGFELDVRQIDIALTNLEIRGTQQEDTHGRQRAEFVRSTLGE